MSAETVVDCLSCRHYKALAPSAGMCRAHPPTTQIIGLDQLGQPQQMSFFPQVGRGVSCGEHALKFTLSLNDAPAGSG